MVLKRFYNVTLLVHTNWSYAIPRACAYQATLFSTHFQLSRLRPWGLSGCLRVYQAGFGRRKWPDKPSDGVLPLLNYQKAD